MYFDIYGWNLMVVSGCLKGGVGMGVCVVLNVLFKILNI